MARYSAHSRTTEADFTIPSGTKVVNYTIFNPSSASLTVAAAESRFYRIDYPNLWLGSSLLYLGIAIVVSSLLGLGLWVMRRRSVRPGSRSNLTVAARFFSSTRE